MELGHRACLIGLQVLQVKAPHQEVLAPDVLRHQIDLVDVVEVGAFLRPVVVALPDAVLREGCQHDNDRTAALPHHRDPSAFAS